MRLVSATIVFYALGLCAFVPAHGSAIQGRVTDISGQPLRAVLVKVTTGARSVSRFTDNNGAYRLEDTPSGPVTVAAFLTGYVDTSTKLTSAQTTVDLKMEKRWDRNQLSGAEILTALPQNAEIDWLKARCITCHGLSQPEHLRGLPENAWKGVFTAMVLNYGRDDLTDIEKDYAAKIVAKYFGPGAAAPTEQSVKLERINDAALKATYYEMDLPSQKGFPHSIVADNKGNAWVAEFGANKMAKWSFAKQTVEELPIRLPADGRAGPHTPTIGPDGKIWTALLYGRQITVVDPATNTIDYIPLDMSLAHTLSTDSAGNIWGDGTKVYRVDPKTRQVTYWSPVSYTESPAGSWEELGRVPGTARPAQYNLYAYHVVVDSKGMAWYTSLETGWLVRLNPKSGEQKVFKALGVAASRGLAVDAQDNIWYTNWGGYGVARLDQKSGKIDLFKMPTRYSMPYSVFIDKKRGFIWLADYAGNNLTRLDPRTGQFVDFPLPTRESYPRFISVDNEGRVWFTEWWQSKVGLLDPDSSAGPPVAAAH